VNFTWKVVIGGLGAVGKTTFIHRFLTGQFIEGTALTVGVEFHSHLMEHEGKKINLVIWDLGGQERFRPLQSKFMEGAVAALVMFDMSRMKTLHETSDWIEMIRKNASSSIPVLLIGGKADLLEEEMQKFI
jgi:small GTP-binding protein